MQGGDPDHRPTPIPTPAPAGAAGPGPAFLRGAGAAGALIGRLGPADGPLGAPETWPAALRGALGALLPSRAQVVLFWGPDHVALYNDAYAPTIGDKHPRALGRPARENWAETWDVLGPLLDGVRRTGETLEARDHPFLLARHGYLEEVFLDISYSPLHEGEAVAGVLCLVAETTERVLAGRRLGALHAAGLRLAGSADVGAACADALSALAEANPRDLPWGLMLLAGEDGPRAVAAHGSPGPIPERVVAAVLADARPREVPGGMAGGVAEGPVEGLVEGHGGALALPLMAGAAVAGVFLAGLNPNQRLEGDYGRYLGLAAGQVSLAVTRLRREEEERRAGALLREGEARFRNMADHAPVMVWVTEADGRCTYLSPRWYAFTGQTPGTALGFGWLDAVHPDDREAVAGVVARAAATASPFKVEYRLRGADGHHAWMIDAAAPRTDGEGRFAGFVGSVLDITDRRRAEEARDLLSRELSHRIKNIFMVTGGLAALTARGDPAAEAFAARLQARLRALSLAHDLVRPDGGPPDGPEAPGPAGAPAGARSLTMHGLIRALLAPYGDADRVHVAVEGEDCPLGYAAANALALVLHEQATNAVKYGALSRPGGMLRIVTRVDGAGGDYRLDWLETGGPPVDGSPIRRGFGTALAARSLAGQVRGRMTHDWRPEGLALRLEVPLAALAR